jgi:predicted phosphoribosyltransferase
MQKIFQNRTEAGRLLAKRLSAYGNRDDVLVLALPRGGVPVAFEVARSLNAPLDVLIVRKLGVPGQEELAMGAVASGGLLVLNQELIQELELPQDVIQHVEARERKEVNRREQMYRINRTDFRIERQVVLLIDDGIATGSTMQAAIQALRLQKPRKIVVAVPTAAGSSFLFWY